MVLTDIQINYWLNCWTNCWWNENRFLLNINLLIKLLINFWINIDFDLIAIKDKSIIDINFGKTSTMKKSSGFFRGMFDGLRSTVSQPSSGSKSEFEVEETLKSDHFQVAKVGKHLFFSSFIFTFKLFFNFNIFF
jgi:hypothetical protein